MPRITFSKALAHPHGIDIWCNACRSGKTLTQAQATALGVPGEATLDQVEKKLRCECGAVGEAAIRLSSPSGRMD